MATLPPQERALTALLVRYLDEQGVEAFDQVAASSELTPLEEQRVPVSVGPRHPNVGQPIAAVRCARGIDIPGRPPHSGSHRPEGHLASRRRRMRGVQPEKRVASGAPGGNPARLERGTGASLRGLLWSVLAVGWGLVVMVVMYWAFDVLPLLLLFGVVAYYAVQSSRRTPGQGAPGPDGLRR